MYTFFFNTKNKYILVKLFIILIGLTSQTTNELIMPLYFFPCFMQCPLIRDVFEKVGPYLFASWVLIGCSIFQIGRTP